MRRVLVLLVAVSIFAVVAAAPAAGGNGKGKGELMASFQAGLSGGAAIDVHSAVAASVASPQVNPEGRIEPFGGTEFICDQLPVGTWVFVVDEDRALLDAWTNEFKLDGEVLETTRTPNKRVTQGAGKGSWWFAEGVPVLGVLDPAVYDIEFTADDGFGNTFTLNTAVDVDSGNC